MWLYPKVELTLKESSKLLTRETKKMGDGGVRGRKMRGKLRGSKMRRWEEKKRGRTFQRQTSLEETSLPHCL